MRWTLLFALALAGCQEIRAATNGGTQSMLAQEAASQQEDVDSWRGVPLIELETHPVYSTLPRQASELSDGTQLWSYSRCTQYEVPARCTGYPIGSVQFTQCTGGRVDQTCCIRQFRIAGGAVQSFRALGPCLTGCRFRPGACQARL
jgi:hypothetical protein